MEKKATLKKAIKPVKLVVTVTASRVNENGTFSGIQIESVKGLDGLYAVSPPLSGGGIFFKVDTLEALTVLENEVKGASGVKKEKLF